MNKHHPPTSQFGSARRANDSFFHLRDKRIQSKNKGHNASVEPRTLRRSMIERKDEEQLLRQENNKGHLLFK